MSESEKIKGNKVPMLDGSNYNYWKIRMTVYLQSLDERIWQTVLDGYSRPTVDNEGVVGPKPVATWTARELEAARWNSQGLNAILSHVTQEEFKKISNCTTSKQAWDVLTVIFEGTSTVKKLQDSKIND